MENTIHLLSRKWSFAEHRLSFFDPEMIAPQNQTENPKNDTRAQLKVSEQESKGNEELLKAYDRIKKQFEGVKNGQGEAVFLENRGLRRQESGEVAASWEMRIGDKKLSVSVTPAKINDRLTFKCEMLAIGHSFHALDPQILFENATFVMKYERSATYADVEEKVWSSLLNDDDRIRIIGTDGQLGENMMVADIATALKGPAVTGKAIDESFRNLAVRKYVKELFLRYPNVKKRVEQWKVGEAKKE